MTENTRFGFNYACHLVYSNTFLLYSYIYICICTSILLLISRLYRIKIIYLLFRICFPILKIIWIYAGYWKVAQEGHYYVNLSHTKTFSKTKTKINIHAKIDLFYKSFCYASNYILIGTRRVRWTVNVGGNFVEWTKFSFETNVMCYITMVIHIKSFYNVIILLGICHLQQLYIP